MSDATLRGPSEEFSLLCSSSPPAVMPFQGLRVLNLTKGLYWRTTMFMRCVHVVVELIGWCAVLFLCCYIGLGGYNQL